MRIFSGLLYNICDWKITNCIKHVVEISSAILVAFQQSYKKRVKYQVLTAASMKITAVRTSEKSVYFSANYMALFPRSVTSSYKTCLLASSYQHKLTAERMIFESVFTFQFCLKSSNINGILHTYTWVSVHISRTIPAQPAKRWKICFMSHTISASSRTFKIVT
jgi:hypothetical protein